MGWFRVGIESMTLITSSLKTSWPLLIEKTWVIDWWSKFMLAVGSITSRSSSCWDSLAYLRSVFDWVEKKENKLWNSDVFPSGPSKSSLQNREKTERKKLLKWASKNTLKIHLQVSNVLVFYFFPFIFSSFATLCWFFFSLIFFSLLLTW